jgi:UDP-glucose 4-epimerase
MVKLMCQINENAAVKSAMSLMEIPNKLGEVIADVVKVSGVTAIFVRYFNPIGSHPSIEIEITAGVPQNLVPFMQTGMGLRESWFTEMITNS